MPQEYLNVVDDLDQVIDARPRAEIHVSGLRHRAVHILVYNDQNQLFLQQRSQKKDLNKGLWDSSAAGHVDVGESYDHCAGRELWEELGISAELEFQFKLEACEHLGMEFIKVYRCRHNGPFVLAAEEIDAGAWLSETEVNQRVNTDDPMLTASFKSIWQRYQQV
jgi:isopentenyldiphosphate isomerase